MKSDNEPQMPKAERRVSTPVLAYGVGILLCLAVWVGFGHLTWRSLKAPSTGDSAATGSFRR